MVNYKKFIGKYYKLDGKVFKVIGYDGGEFYDDYTLIVYDKQGIYVKKITCMSCADFLRYATPLTKLPFKKEVQVLYHEEL